jgi:hypothetical protein
MLSGLETVPLQSRTASRTNMDEHFISAEECLRIFPKKLKESFRVTCNSLHRSSSKAPPCSDSTAHTCMSSGIQSGLVATGDIER